MCRFVVENYFQKNMCVKGFVICVSCLVFIVSDGCWDVCARKRCALLK